MALELKDLIENKIYYFKWGSEGTAYIWKYNTGYAISKIHFYKNFKAPAPVICFTDAREATLEEQAWLIKCITLNKFTLLKNPEYVECVVAEYSYDTHPNAKEYGAINYSRKGCEQGKIYKVKNTCFINNNIDSYCLEDEKGLHYLIDKKGIKLSTKEEYDAQNINTYGLKIGDILKVEVINAWVKEHKNYFVSYWKQDFTAGFIGDRTILSFKVLDGIVGFEVSKTGDIYLKAEGFKEFAENFNKPKYVVGQWYTHHKWGQNSYIKFDSIRDWNSVNESERISQGIYKKEGTWSISYEHTLEAVSLDEIQSFLPENHPNKIKSMKNKYEYEVVHCKTQKEWDFVHRNINNKQGNNWYRYKEKTCLCFKQNDKAVDKYADIEFFKENNSKIYSFEEWCNLNGIMLEKEEYKIGDWIVIKEEPQLWNSELNSNCPCYNDIKYPITVQITKKGKWEKDDVIEAGNYGFCLTHLIKKNNVRKALSYEIPLGDGILNQIQNIENNRLLSIDTTFSLWLGIKPKIKNRTKKEEVIVQKRVKLRSNRKQFLNKIKNK